MILTTVFMVENTLSLTYSFSEVEKFAELLDKGNPKLIEPLFAKKLLWSTPEWDALLPVRE